MNACARARLRPRAVWQESVPVLLARGVRIQTLVSDANMPPADTVDIVAACASLLAPGALLLLTLKNQCKKRREWEGVWKEQLRRLNALCGGGARQVWLLANKDECTLVAHYNPK